MANTGLLANTGNFTNSGNATIGSNGTSINVMQGATNTITSTKSATVQVVGSTSKLVNATQGVSGKSEILATQRDTQGNVTREASNSVTLTNGIGNKHGLEVYEDRTVVSGGINSTQTTWLENEVHFEHVATGAPVKLTGVANGTNPYDAVNFSQLNNLSNRVDGIANRAYSGIAQVTAIAAIPGPVYGNNYSVGVGTGYYAGQTAMAFGVKANISNHIQVGASFSTGFSSGSSTAASAGAAFSW